MATHTNAGFSRRAGRRSWLTLAAALLIILATAVQTSAGNAITNAKPVIGKPVASPRQPLAGKRFTVSFKVTQGVAGARVLRGTMVCDPSIAGRVIRHAESFKRGIARLSLVVPTNAAGRTLKVKVAIKATTGSAKRVSTFRVQSAASPVVSIAGASIGEGNSGTTTLSFPVSLSVAATQPVSVAYATADGTATAPSDYSAANGTLTFARGQTAKSIQVAVVGDPIMEQDETLTVTLSSPVNATLGTATATGTITNDDTAVPVTSGSYKGATQEGNYVFFVVTGNRTLTAFRINALPCQCDGPLALTGGEDFGDSTFTIGADGSFSAKGEWTGSRVQGDAEWLHWDVTLTGHFTTPTAVTGTILENYELKYKGTRYRCSTGLVTWTATVQT